MRTGKGMRRIAQIYNQLAHLPHIQQLPGLDRRLARRHMQHLLPQVAAAHAAQLA